MTRMLRTALSLGLIGIAVPTVLSAQDPQPGPPAPAEEAPAAPAAEALLEAIEAAPEVAIALAERTELAAEDVRVVQADELFGEDNASELDGALEKHQEALAGLREAIAANAALTAVLEAKELSAEQVVALQLPEDGGVVVYVRSAKEG